MTVPPGPTPPSGERGAARPGAAASRELRRTLGLARVSLSGIGVILGAGVYALVAPTAAQAGGARWLSFVLAGVVAGFTAYSYARFATLQAKDSPEFQYTAMAFSQHPAEGLSQASAAPSPRRMCAPARTSWAL